MKRLIFSFVIAGTAAFAHEGAIGIVKERMDGMKAIGASLKSIAPMMTGKVTFDQELALEASKAIAVHSGENMIALFPEGSLDHPTEASPVIWENPDEFAEIALQLEALAKKIPDPDLSVEDRATLFEQIGQTCKDCHQGYRISN